MNTNTPSKTTDEQPINTLGLRAEGRRKPVFAETGVAFHTEDEALQRLFDTAEVKALSNVRYFSPRYTVMVEGGGYPFLWAETQPMGGVMYAKRDLRIAYDNVMIFLDYQRADGRIAGTIGDYALLENQDLGEGWERCANNWTKGHDGRLGGGFGSLQGFYLAAAALELSYLLGHDAEYLQALAEGLEAYDAYLWRTRDSTGDGCLESWTMTDTGEDNLKRFKYAPWYWTGDVAPAMRLHPKHDDPNDIGECPVPMKSIDIMGYSYSCRSVLAKISAIRNDGREGFWREQAEKVSEKMREYLWLPERAAYFFRNKRGEIIPTMTHNNLRAMYFGTMTQDMADAFIRHHLLNPEEFWTPMPLPSVAANDPDFQNAKHNNWSGQPQGLTYQRAIRALENYGHHAEVRLIGRKLIAQTSQTLKFTQQFDPFTGEQDGGDNYGPTLLSVLEYISRLYGVYLKNGEVYFSGLPHTHAYDYTQRFGTNRYSIRQNDGIITGWLNGEECFTASAGLCVVTDGQGAVLRLIGIDSEEREVSLTQKGKIYTARVKPNASFVIQKDTLTEETRVPFDFPYVKP